MTTLHVQLVRRVMVGAIFPLVVAMVAPRAQGQMNDPRWDAWNGCWQEVVDSPVPLLNGAVVCVSPTGSASAVELATVEQGRVTTRDTIDASGARRSSDAQGCSAWRSAEWSHDTRRIYLRSETACGTAPLRTSSGRAAWPT